MNTLIVVGLSILALLVIVGVVLAVVLTLTRSNASDDSAPDRSNDSDDSAPAFTVSLSGTTGGTTSASAASATKVNDLTKLGIDPHPEKFYLSDSNFPNQDFNNPTQYRFSALYANPNTPASYVIKVHEIGFCSNIGDLKDSEVTLVDKVPVFSMPIGKSIDIGEGRSYDLDTNGVIRPTNDTYKYAYIIMSSTFTYQTSLDLEFATDSAESISWDSSKPITGIHSDFIGKHTYYTGATDEYYAKSDLNGTNTDIIGNWLGDTYNPILDSLSQQPYYATAAQFPDTEGKTKQVRAYLALPNNALDIDTATYGLTGGDSAPYAKYIIGVVELYQPITINDTTIQNVNCNIDTACLRMMAMASYTCQTDSGDETCEHKFKVFHELGPFAMSFTTDPSP